MIDVYYAFETENKLREPALVWVEKYFYDKFGYFDDGGTNFDKINDALLDIGCYELMEACSGMPMSEEAMVSAMQLKGFNMIFNPNILGG